MMMPVVSFPMQSLLLHHVHSSRRACHAEGRVHHVVVFWSAEEEDMLGVSLMAQHKA
jgi:hypothetical protein